MADEPTNPPPLDYRSPTTADRRAGPASGQVLVGFFAWLATVAATCGFAGIFEWAGGRYGPAAAVVLSLPAVGMIAFGVWLHVRHGWRRFLPGLLLGFGLTCLVPVGIVAVVCGAFK